MGTPQDYLPAPFSGDAINDLLHSIGLPTATSIVRPSLTGDYHLIYMITIPPNATTTHTKLVLRISGNHLPKIKTDNEIAVMTWNMQNTTIPTAHIIAYDNSTANPVGHEYILLSHVEGTILSKVYRSLNKEQIEGLLDELFNYISQLYTHEWSAIGGLKIQSDGEIVVDRIVADSFWFQAEVDTLWPQDETIDTINIGGPYSTYTALMAGQVRTYMHLIKTHESLVPMRDLLPRLKAFLEVLPNYAAELNDVKLRLLHSDMHFGNILYDVTTNKITAILDWEFSRVVPFPMWKHGFLWDDVDIEVWRPTRERLLEKFEERMRNQSAAMLGDSKFHSPLHESLQNVADFLRAITEVVPRGYRQELVPRWKKTLLENLSDFGV